MHKLNVLSRKLQGQGQLIGTAYDNMWALSTKLVLWKAQLPQTNLCRSPVCKALVDAGTPFSGKKYVEAILKLQEEFDQIAHRFRLQDAQGRFSNISNPSSF